MGFSGVENSSDVRINYSTIKMWLGSIIEEVFCSYFWVTKHPRVSIMVCFIRPWNMDYYLIKWTIVDTLTSQLNSWCSVLILLLDTGLWSRLTIGPSVFVCHLVNLSSSENSFFQL